MSNELAQKQENLVENANSGILALVEKMAVNPDVDPAKLEKMLDMQERIFKHNAEIAFNKAMVECQKEIPTVQKDAQNKQTSSDYARLETMQHTAMPVITKNGFSLSYGTADAPSEMEIRVTLKVSHADGHSRDYFADFPIDDTGAKGNPTKTKLHGTASAMTYGQRYLMKMAFNIQVGGLDNDGNGDPISGEQAANIYALIEEVKADKAKFLKYIGSPTVEQIPASQYEKAVKGLEAKRANS